jgi:hypothetical protein
LKLLSQRRQFLGGALLRNGRGAIAEGFRNGLGIEPFKAAGVVEDDTTGLE